MKETIKIGIWDVPLELFNEYIRYYKLAEDYLLNKRDIPSHTEYERRSRWSLCVGMQIKIHMKICRAIGVKYTIESADLFYREFHKKVEEHSSSTFRL